MTEVKNNATSLRALLLKCLLLSVVCFVVISLLHQPSWPSNWRQIVLMVVIVCNAATIPPALISSGVKDPRMAVTKVLLTTVWRLGTMIAVLVFWTATKWPPSEFAAKCLVGCYFPFLVLESWHSIRHTKY